MADIHELMRAFASLAFAEVGRGPRHPTLPDPALRPAIEQFLGQHPILRRDQGYVDFLECYAGASITDEASDRFVDILGFSPVSSDIRMVEGSVVDEQGFLLFCTSVFHPEPSLDIERGHHPVGIWELDFAFDVTGERRPGVYRALSHPGTSEPYSWLTATFLEWLEQLVRTEGRLPGRPDASTEARDEPGAAP